MTDISHYTDCAPGPNEYTIMNTQCKPNNPPNPPDPQPPSPVAWIGLDWGCHSHAFALLDQSGQRQEGTLPATPEALHAWLEELGRRFAGRPVSLAFEARPDAVLHVLVQYPWLTLYSLNPITSARYRQAFTPSGASDDVPDARVLLELVHRHADKLRPVELQDAQTVQLAGLVEARRQMVDHRTQVLNQLTSLLRSYYPQALNLVGSLDSDLAVDFLSRWPDLIALKAAKTSAVKRFYYAHNLRRPERLQERLQAIQQAVALTTEEAVVSVARLRLSLLVDQLRAFRKHIAILDAEIKNAFKRHPESALFRNLPGAGPALAPRLCVAFGTVRTLYPEPTSLQKLAGLAPVREKSGSQEWIHWRWQASRFLRQTFVEWAGQTVHYSAWAAVFYERMRAEGKAHHAILRALAFRWVRVLWKCWQTRIPYDEGRYLEQLRMRKSPNAVAR
jgi:transposase